MSGLFWGGNRFIHVLHQAMSAKTIANSMHATMNDANGADTLELLGVGVAVGVDVGMITHVSLGRGRGSPGSVH